MGIIKYLAFTRMVEITNKKQDSGAFRAAMSLMLLGKARKLQTHKANTHNRRMTKLLIHLLQIFEQCRTGRLNISAVKRYVRYVNQSNKNALGLQLRHERFDAGHGTGYRTTSGTVMTCYIDVVREPVFDLMITQSWKKKQILFKSKTTTETS